jgi:hypothetical protein
MSDEPIPEYTDLESVYGAGDCTILQPKRKTRLTLAYSTAESDAPVVLLTGADEVRPRYDNLKIKFKERFGVEPEFYSRAPGKPLVHPVLVGKDVLYSLGCCWKIHLCHTL